MRSTVSRCFLISLLALAFLFLGCQQKEIQLNEIDRRFAALYADLLLLQADYERISGHGGVYSKMDSLQKLFALHGFSSAQFHALFDRYKHDPERWLAVQSHALDLLSMRREYRGAYR